MDSGGEAPVAALLREVKDGARVLTHVDLPRAGNAIVVRPQSRENPTKA